MTMPSVLAMDQQPEIKWLCDTLYLAVNIMDRYISRRVVPIEHYQLIALTALWIAAKKEDHSLGCLLLGPCSDVLTRDPWNSTLVKHMGWFFMELTLYGREFIKYKPSSIAFGALTLARFLLLNQKSLEVAESLDGHLAQHFNDLSEILVKKYSFKFYSEVAPLVMRYYSQHGRRFIHRNLSF
ncbi:hypothetical protein BDZ97DRAFT_1902065 [Flammula alnicola]|nr:hypothetical protein BDZ97DRAFT_1902065 [Flammula alnicola]